MSGSGSMFPTMQGSTGQVASLPQWSPMPAQFGNYQDRLANYKTQHQQWADQSNAAQGAAPFNEAYYLNSNPDVKAAVDAGQFTSGQDHFNQFGQTEGRVGGFVPRDQIFSPQELWQQYTMKEQNRLDQAYNKGTERGDGLARYNNLWDRANSEQYQNRAQRMYNRIWNNPFQNTQPTY